MDRVTVHQSAEISVWYYPAVGLIHHEMHRFCFGEALNTALTKGTDAMIEHKATKWLSDDRKNGALPPEAEAWGREVWFPRTKAAGWKLWGLVPPTMVAGKMNMSRFVSMYGELGITVQVFTDPKPAFDWLAAQT